MPTTRYVKLAAADLDERCYRCGRVDEVCAITVVIEEGNASPNGTVVSLALCSLCLTEAVGKVAGRPLHMTYANEPGIADRRRRARASKS